ncbi:hypothetical protein GKQ23_14745 [Erwinia sp. E602]|uniref:hypothetical protein n=1 Tax=Erwinia sp. E602 TaxID=2675378 RepID=UPI001BA70259|nr:hypothetical protein [Erwinia sp. E602]QUG76179.1 hypothetical protein GKQ23_14745 [Erwinia sp. E602]
MSLVRVQSEEPNLRSPLRKLCGLFAFPAQQAPGGSSTNPFSPFNGPADINPHRQVMKNIRDATLPQAGSHMTFNIGVGCSDLFPCNGWINSSVDYHQRLKNLI